MRFGWLGIFRLWVLLVVFEVAFFPIKFAITIYLSVISVSLLIILTEKQKEHAFWYFLPSFVLIALMTSMSVTEKYIWTLTGTTLGLLTYGITAELNINKKLSALASVIVFINQFIIYTNKEIILRPNPKDILITGALIAMSAIFQKYVPVNLEPLGIGDPRRGRIYNKVEIVPWNDKWPRLADIVWRPLKPDDIVPVYTDGEKWYAQYEIIDIRYGFTLREPMFKNNTMSFLAFMDNNIVKIITDSPNLSWLRNNTAPPTGTHIKKIAPVKGLKPAWVTSENNKIHIIDHDGNNITYKDGDDKIEVHFSNHEKLEIPLDKLNNMSWDDIMILGAF